MRIIIYKGFLLVEMNFNFRVEVLKLKFGKVYKKHDLFTYS